MLFSFIVPVYNTSKYLDMCMESLLCQKGARYEIILVDDGSTDNSGLLCDHYLERYPDIVRVIHKDNEGLLLTRRRGFKEAKGDWFICVDSDDYVDEGLLESVIEVIEKYNPDMVMYNFSYFTDAGEVSKSRLTIPDKSIFEGAFKQQVYEQRLLSDDINSLCMKALKREIVDMDTDYSQCDIRNMCEDAYQSLPLFTNADKIVYIADPLYYYRKGQKSITSIRTYEHWLASKTCFLRTEQYLNTWNISVELRRKYYTRHTEVLSNFIRWAFSLSESNLPKMYSDILHDIHIHPAFHRCMKMYNKAFAKTSYLKFSVPRIMKYVQKENVKGLIHFFALERIIRSRR